MPERIAPRKLGWIIVAMVTLCGAFLLSRVSLWFTDSTTTQSLSPNDAYRISLVERKPHLPLKIDRNFAIILETLADGEYENLFDAPDEGKPIGSERFVWSKDSDYVLLVGRHFIVDKDLPVGNGEQAYFLYHLPSKRSWRNARQAAGERLTATQLEQIDFVPPLAAPSPSE